MKLHIQAVVGQELRRVGLGDWVTVSDWTVDPWDDVGSYVRLSCKVEGFGEWEHKTELLMDHLSMIDDDAFRNVAKFVYWRGAVAALRELTKQGMAQEGGFPGRTWAFRQPPFDMEAWRKSKGWTVRQTSLAMGVDDSTIVHWRNGTKNINKFVEILAGLIDRYGVPEPSEGKFDMTDFIRRWYLKEYHVSMLLGVGQYSVSKIVTGKYELKETYARILMMIEKHEPERLERAADVEWRELYGVATRQKANPGEIHSA